MRLGTPPGLGSPTARVGLPTTEARKRRDEWAPLRRWYRTARWRQLRKSTLLWDLFTCRICGDLVGDSSKLVADHIQPHRGNPDLFFDPEDLQTLCASCHSGAKQRAERDAHGEGVVDLEDRRRPRTRALLTRRFFCGHERFWD